MGKFKVKRKGKKGKKKMKKGGNKNKKGRQTGRKEGGKETKIWSKNIKEERTNLET